MHKAALEGFTRCVEVLLEEGTSKDCRDWARTSLLLGTATAQPPTSHHD